MVAIHFHDELEIHAAGDRVEVEFTLFFFFFVEFEKDEPICHFFPLRRGEIERFEPEFLPLSADPDLEAEYRTWSESRRDFNRELKVPGSKAKADKWQKFYYRGAAADFTKLAPAEHRTRLKVKDFRK